MIACIVLEYSQINVFTPVMFELEECRKNHCIDFLATFSAEGDVIG